MLFHIADRTANKIRFIGYPLVAVGGGLAIWGYMHFEQLPSYLRLAAFVPLLSSIPMLFIEDYRGGWEVIQGITRGRAIGSLITPPLLALGSILWYFLDPSAKS